MSAHTPPPWILNSDGEVITSMNRDVCVTHAFDETDRANAAFIVTACNAHDELVAALELAEVEMRYGGFNVPQSDNVCRNPAYLAVVAAIAKAQP